MSSQGGPSLHRWDLDVFMSTTAPLPANWFSQNAAATMGDSDTGSAAENLADAGDADSMPSIAPDERTRLVSLSFRDILGHTSAPDVDALVPPVARDEH